MQANKNNYCVIMAGGIGSRFWPFSRSERPKQFLDFFGTGRSLLQMTVDRFRPLVPIENVLIVTNVSYKQLIMEQVPELRETQILCEPARRNTAPCIAYAVSHIKALQAQRMGGVADIRDLSHPAYNANIVVAASDHLILQEQAFQQTIRESFEFVEHNDAILTLGMKPTRPETGYGYIQYLHDEPEMPASAGVRRVKTFTEKPNLDLAKVFLESGEFLWNSGIFVWNLRTICSAFRKYMPELAEKFLQGEQMMGTPREEHFIEEMFPTCPNISIDYGVLEKADNVFVKPSDFGWSDLGTWGSLYELSDKDEQGNVSLHSQAVFYDSRDNVVTLEPGKLAVVQGMEDMIVAEQQGVLLICKKQEEQRIKQFVNDITERYGKQYV